MESIDKKTVRTHIIDIQIKHFCYLDGLIKSLTRLLKEHKSSYEKLIVNSDNFGYLSVVGERLETDVEYHVRLEKSNRIKEAVLQCKTESNLKDYKKFIELKRKFDSENLTQTELDLLEKLDDEDQRCTGGFIVD